MVIRKISYYMRICSPSYERSKRISGLDLFTKMLLPRAGWLGPALARSLELLLPERSWEEVEVEEYSSLIPPER
jgi:hypothetical protein